MKKEIDVIVIKLYETLPCYRIYIDTKYSGDFSVDLEKKTVTNRANWIIERIFDLLEDVHVRNEPTQAEKRKIYKNYIAFLETYMKGEVSILILMDLPFLYLKICIHY